MSLLNDLNWPAKVIHRLFDRDRFYFLTTESFSRRDTMEGVPDPNVDVKRKRYSVRAPTMPNGIGIKLARSRSKLKERVGSRLTRQDSAGKYVNAAEDAKQVECEVDAEEPFQFEDATDDEVVQVGSLEESTSSPSVDGSHFMAVSPCLESNAVTEAVEVRKQLLPSTLITPSAQLESEAESPAVPMVPKTECAAPCLEYSEPNELSAFLSIKSEGTGTESASRRSSLVPAEEGIFPRRLETSLSARENANRSSASDESAQIGAINWSASVTDLIASSNGSHDDDEEMASSGWRLIERLSSGAFNMSMFVTVSFEFVLLCIMLPFRLYLRSAGIRARRWKRVSPIVEDSPQKGTVFGTVGDELDAHDSPIAGKPTSPEQQGSFPNEATNATAPENETTQHVSEVFASNPREERDGRDQFGRKLSEMSTDLKRSLKKTLSKGRLSRKGSMHGAKKSPIETTDEAMISEASPVSATLLVAALSEEERNGTLEFSADSAEKLNSAEQAPADDPAGDVTTGDGEIAFTEMGLESDKHVRRIEPRTKSIVREMNLGTRSESSNDVRFESDSCLNVDNSQNLHDDGRQRPNGSSIDAISEQEDRNDRDLSYSNELDDTSVSADPAALIPAKSAQREDYDEYETTTDDGRGHKEKILNDERTELLRKNSAASPAVAQVGEKLSQMKNGPKALLRSLGGLRRPAEDTQFASARSARKTAILLTDILKNEMGAVCSNRRGANRLLVTKDFDVTSRLSAKINIDPLDEYSCNVTFLRDRGDKSGSDAFLSFVSDAHRRFVAHTTQGKPTVF